MASGEPPHQADAEQEALEAADDPSRPNPWMAFSEEAGKRLEPNLRSGEAMCHEVDAHGAQVMTRHGKKQTGHGAYETGRGRRSEAGPRGVAMPPWLRGVPKAYPAPIAAPITSPSKPPATGDKSRPNNPSTVKRPTK